jgi:catechol 2,3-dioxygenase-like lactoylglutathione lyase family enzyme
MSKPSRLDHVALAVTDVPAAVRWWTEHFACRVKYADATWAQLDFENTSLALVTEGQHPLHLGFLVPDASAYGKAQTHRDGTKSVYAQAPGGAIEYVERPTPPSP